MDPFPFHARMLTVGLMNQLLCPTCLGPWNLTSGGEGMKKEQTHIQNGWCQAGSVCSEGVAPTVQ